MIKLTERWSIKSDKYQWILVEGYEGKDKDGNAKHKTRETYHKTLQQVVRYITNEEAKAAEELVYILDIVGNLGREIYSNLIKYGVTQGVR